MSAKRGQRVRLASFSPLGSAIFDLIVASIFMNILSLALPLSMLQVYDRIIPNESLGTLFLLVMGIVVFVLLEMVLKLGRANVSGWVGARFEYAAGCAALDRLLRTGMQDYERDGSGVHVEQMSALKTIKEYYAGQILLTLFDLPFAFVFLGLIWIIAGTLAVVPAGIMLLFFLVAAAGAHGLRKALENQHAAHERRLNFTIEVLHGIHTIKAMAMESAMGRRYERLQEGAAGTNYDVALNSNASMSLGGFFSQLTMVAVASYGATLVIDGTLSVGGLAACTLLSGRTLQPLQRVVGMWTRFQTISLARKRVQRVFDLPVVWDGSEPDLPDVIDGRLTLRGVAFRYGEKEAFLFRGVDLDLAPGACIGIAAKNGVGKTTLLNVMHGNLPPTEGEVLIDGEPVRMFSHHSVKMRIAYLPQDGELFQGTLIENITMFDPTLTDDAQEVATELGLDEVVARMPLGYETRVGEGAYDALPTGIKQRVAIARALLSRPQVLLFDEANMAVDSVGDGYIRAALERRKGVCTIVLVSARPSLLKLADQVYDFENGGIVARAVEAAQGAPLASASTPAPLTAPSPSLPPAPARDSDAAPPPPESAAQERSEPRLPEVSFGGANSPFVRPAAQPPSPPPTSGPGEGDA